jgi:hypothetical protein
MTYEKTYNWYNFKNNYDINNNVLLRETFNYNVLNKLYTGQYTITYGKTYKWYNFKITII